MKNKKTFLIIAVTIISLGLLALILALTSCSTDTKTEAAASNEVLQLNSLEKLNRVVLINEGEVTSGIPDGINIEDEDMSGYRIASTFYYTPNMDRDKAFHKLKDYMLYYDGKPIHADYDVTATFNNDRVTLSGTYPNGQRFSMNSPAVEIDAIDGVEFMTATPFSFTRYAIVVAKNSIKTNYDVNKIATYALKSRFYSFKDPEFDLTYNDSLQEENEIWSESYYQAGNGKYKSIMANVRILNGISLASYTGEVNNDSYQPNENTNTQMEQQFPEDEAPDINNPDNPNYNGGNAEEVNTPNEVETPEEGFNLGETIQKGYEDFKTNVQNNETFRVVTITVSSVVGIALLYVVFLIIRKIWHVIRN